MNTSKLIKFAQHILITGVPGSGKTTFAREKARELGIPHVELDKYLRKNKMNAIDAIRNIETPSVVDGVQILGVDPGELKGHKIETMDATDERLMKVFLESGSWSGRDDQEERIREAIALARLKLDKFRASLAASETERTTAVNKLSTRNKESSLGLFLGVGATTALLASIMKVKSNRKRQENIVARGVEKSASQIPLLDGILKNALRHVLITGAPGSGKTTLAWQRAKERGLPLVELDKYFQKLKPGEYDKQTALETINSIEDPSVVEGVQILELNEDSLKGNEIVVLNPSQKVLVNRLIDRGWKDGAGIERKGEKDRERAIEVSKEFRELVAEFNRKRGEIVPEKIGATIMPPDIKIADLKSGWLLEGIAKRAEVTVKDDWR